MNKAEKDNEDSVAATFKRMRQEAKNRGGKLPDLAAPAASRETSISRSRNVKKPHTLGKPTGKDGRYIPYGQTSLEGFGTLVQREIRNRGWSKPIAGGWVHSHWPELVGEHVAAHTKVEMLKDKALFISCDSTAWATNLRMMQRQILQTIAKKVGPDVVRELKIFGPKTPSWRFGPLHVKGRGPRDTYG